MLFHFVTPKLLTVPKGFNKFFNTNTTTMQKI